MIAPCLRTIYPMWIQRDPRIESLAILLILGPTPVTFSLVGGDIATLRHVLSRGQRPPDKALRHTERLAVHDEVTWLCDRSYLEQRRTGEVQRADTALYRAKLVGRDHVEGETRAKEPQGNAAA